MAQNTQKTHQFSPSPLARESARRVSPNRVRHERVSSYGAQPVPIVTCARAVWAAGSAWYSPSTEGAVVQLDILHRPAIYLALALFPRRGTIWRRHQRKRVKPCEIRERSTQRDRGQSEAKCVAHIVDRDRHRRGMDRGMCG